MSQGTMPTISLCVANARCVFNQVVPEKSDFNSFYLFSAVMVAIPGKQTVFRAGYVS